MTKLLAIGVYQVSCTVIITQALQPSRNFCGTQEIRPFSRSHCRNGNLKKFKLFNYKADKNAFFVDTIA